MNDPHVVALTYRIEHGPAVDFSRTERLDHKEAGFRIKVTDDQVRFEFKAHYATEEAAREVIEDYIRRWEFTAGLSRGPGYFKLRFDRAEIEDRKPTPGTVSLLGQPIRISFTTSVSAVTVSPARYPPPPSGVSLSADVETMYVAYTDYCQGRRSLVDMAYFCLDILQGPNGRKSAAEAYQISRKVLKRIQMLSSTRGGPQARKEIGRHQDLTDQERFFLEESTKAMIYRAAEKAHTPESDLPKITLSDLPRA